MDDREVGLPSDAATGARAIHSLWTGVSRHVDCPPPELHDCDLFRQTLLEHLFEGQPGRGVRSELISIVEERLGERGVRVWFGNVTLGLDAERLRRFYGRHGFDVGVPGRSLPPLLGRKWVMPGTPPPAFYFWRRL